MLLTSGQTLRDAKLVMLGSSTVGKSSIVTRLIRETFASDTVSTVGATFLSKTIEVENMQVKLQIWDTGGSERYRSMAPMYFHDADAAVIVYDMTSRQSFDDVDIWLKELNDKGPQSIVIALAGNKSDLSGQRAITERMANDYAEKHGIETFMETSALSGENITELFTEIARRIVTAQPGMRKNRPVNLRKQEKQNGCC